MSSIYNDVALTPIDHITFGVMSPDEIAAYSVCEITTYDSVENASGISYYKIGGPSDPRLGTMSRGQNCPMCQQSREDCPGHFGHLDLPTSIYHPLFSKYILQILRCVCIYCCKLRIGDFGDDDDIDDDDGSPSKRLSKLCEISQNIRQCPHCESILPKITRVNDKYGWTIGVDDDNIPDITGNKAYLILSNIDSKTAACLGFEKQHPVCLIWKTFPVPPLHLRPPMSFEPGTRVQDDWTTKLYDIIKTTVNMEQYYNTPYDTQISQYYQRLSFSLHKYCDNDSGSAASDGARWIQRNGQPLNGSRQLLEGKEGRMRGNLMGKRVNECARTVIGPDPNIRVEQVGVPIEFCKTLTFTEVVSDLNIEYLQALVNNGAHVWPGANYIIRGNRKYDLSMRTENEKPQIVNIGDRVVRHLLTHDVTIFNRQPSLHKMSMMGHRVLPLPGKSFRLNLSTTTPYNADFDG